MSKRSADEPYAWERTVDGDGREQAVLYDTTNPERWLSVEVVHGGVPDFSDPSTWATLRARREQRDRNRGESRYRVR